MGGQAAKRHARTKFKASALGAGNDLRAPQFNEAAAGSRGYPKGSLLVVARLIGRRVRRWTSASENGVWAHGKGGGTLTVHYQSLEQLDDLIAELNA